MHRVVESGEVLKAMGARVTVRFYPGMAHTVSLEELAELRELMDAV